MSRVPIEQADLAPELVEEFLAWLLRRIRLLILYCCRFLIESVIHRTRRCKYARNVIKDEQLALAMADQS